MLEDDGCRVSVLAGRRQKAECQAASRPENAFDVSTNGSRVAEITIVNGAPPQAYIRGPSL